jgi:hypothetical protein
MRGQKPKVDPARIRSLWSEGLTHQEIGARLGLYRKTVAKWLRRLGCAAHGQRAISAQAKRRLAFARQLAAAGVRSLRSINPDAYRRRNADLAKSYGLPDDLFPVQVIALVALAGGPLTTGRLAESCNRRPDRRACQSFNYSRCQGGNYLFDLRRRGLVAMVRQHRGKGQGRGQADGLWLLTPLALDLLSQANVKEDLGDNINS